MVKANKPPKLPTSAKTPGVKVARTAGFINDTARLPASIFTPACV